VSLKYRLRNLEKVLTPKDEPIYVLTVGMWERMLYMFVPESKLRPGEKRQWRGPFNSYLAACQWSLNDLKSRYPQVFERLEREGLQQIIDRAVQQKQLMIHLTEELATSPTSPLETSDLNV
jgi:hypothetical protein